MQNLRRMILNVSNYDLLIQSIHKMKFHKKWNMKNKLKHKL